MKYCKQNVKNLKEKSSCNLHFVKTSLVIVISLIAVILLIQVSCNTGCTGRRQPIGLDL